MNVFHAPFIFTVYAGQLELTAMSTKARPAKRAKRIALATPVKAVEARTIAAAEAAEQFSEDELSAMVLRACLIARDAVFNVRDAIASGSKLAILAIKDCEKELDQIERKIDEQLPGAITRVGEAKARELLACLKFITDLERIGDLAYSAVMQLEARREKLPAADSRQLVEMASLLCEMLEQVHQGFLTRDLGHAQSVLQSDPEVDRLCHALFQRHLAATSSNSATKGSAQNFDILLAAQALERIGDHAKNLAEEVCGLAEGRSLRHNARKLAYS
jgi:phosphate transport system protein